MTSRRVRRTVSIAGIAAAFAIAPLSSHATTVIPGGTTSSDDLLVNFNLTNAGLPLPFEDVVVTLFISSPVAGGGDMHGGSPVGIVVDVFSDASGQGSIITTSNSYIDANGIEPGKRTFFDNGIIGDGIFSLGFRVGPGVPAYLYSAVAFAEEIQIGEPGSMQGDQTVQSEQVSGVVVTASTVPEPATFALLGLGLSGLALTRRRQQ